MFADDSDNSEILITDKDFLTQRILIGYFKIFLYEALGNQNGIAFIYNILI